MVTKESLNEAIAQESEKFATSFHWLEEAMPHAFFEETSFENVMLITHSLMGFSLQGYFSTINLKGAAIVLCSDSPDADLKILAHYTMYGIRDYQTFVSTIFYPDTKSPLRIAILHFLESERHEALPAPLLKDLKGHLQARSPDISDTDFQRLIEGMSARFLRAVPVDRLVLALEMYFRTLTRDSCQYEVRYNENWEEQNTASMYIVLAWKNTPKHNFLYRLARIIHRHGFVMKGVNATYVHTTLVMVLGLHGSLGEPVWDVANIPDFIRELITVKYFASFDLIDQMLVSKEVLTGNQANILRAMSQFIHQALVHLDSNLYTLENIEEALCRHPELTSLLMETFKLKLDPDFVNLKIFAEKSQQFLNDIEKIDTGHEENDIRRKHVFRQGYNFVAHTLKTNAYRTNFTSLGFRLDPKYLDQLPFDRSKKFSELPYAIFYIKGMHFFGFHIRFKDLARGGLRTVHPELTERVVLERNNIFTECYNLAYTQQLKNKDIPEGGAKGIIFLKPYERLESEAEIFQRELEGLKIESEKIEERLGTFKREQKLEYLYQAQRAFVETLLILVNYEESGKLRARHILDYWNRPENIFLGPDENMHDSMIQWIANLSVKYHYRMGSSFITSKPLVGINHKEYGVTSLGVNVYLEQTLHFLGIDPKTTLFTLKMSGGPDGDVAGNEILNLYRYYPKTAKLIALTDVSGTIRDPLGLDLEILATLFELGKPIRYYPPEKLNEGGVLIDKQAKKNSSSLSLETLCWRKVHGTLAEEWICANEMNAIVRQNVHGAKVDVFIPAGGRPRTLNESNVSSFLDESGRPTARAIIEGANLYLTPAARHFLEERGVLIIKDSSANKTGVICSSFEVLAGLTLGDALFLENKERLVPEILGRLRTCAYNEASLLLRTHKETGAYLTDLSNKVSERINLFTYNLLDYLETIELPNDPNDPLIRCFFHYCPPLLRSHYRDRLLTEIPEHHKKAIIACTLSTHLVYKKGLSWFPSIVDILPLALSELEFGQIIATD